MTPETMQAIKIVSPGKAEIQTVPLPKLLDHFILVKVRAVAINPTDWKHIDYHFLAPAGATVGCDFMGTVVALGPKVTKDYKPGDRIAGVNHGSNASQLDFGCFGEYCIVKEGATYKVPDHMSDEQAATIGVAIVTIALGLYQNLGMPYPGSQNSGNNEWVLIYGGSSAMGTMAIQCAKLSGYRVVSTCSPRNFEFVKSLGAEAVFDYNDADCSKKINEYTSDSLKLAFDCIAEGKSLEICDRAISSSGGRKASLLPIDHDAGRPDVENLHVNGYTAMGEAFTMAGQHVGAKPENYRVAAEFWNIAGPLFAEGKLITHPQKVNVGGTGLKGVLEGLQTMREGKVSGFKLVYHLDQSQ